MLTLDWNHLVNLGADDSVHAAVRVASHVIEKVFDSLLKRAEAGDDAERIRVQNKRLKDTIESLRTDVEEALRLGYWNAQNAAREASDPGFECFVEDALTTSTSIRSESKRRLLGRLIAQRLQIGTPDEEEVALRRMLRVIPDLTEAQLLALAATWLINSLEAPDGGFADRDAAEAWLKGTYGQVLRHLQEMLPWTNDDLETLGAEGTLRLDISRKDALLISGNLDTIEQWLYRHGVPAHDQLTDDAGSEAWKERYRARFPTIVALRLLAQGHAFLFEADVVQPETYPLAEMLLTPLGVSIGSIVLEQLLTQQHEKVSPL